MADDDADGAGGNPVGGIVGVAPGPLACGIDPAAEDGIPNGVCGALAVVEPYHGVHIIITKCPVHIRPCPNPAIGVWCGGGKSALLGCIIRHNKIGKRSNRRVFSECMALALVGDDDGRARTKIDTPIRLRTRVRQKAQENNA